MNERLEVKHLEGLKWMLKHDYVHQMDRVWVAGVIKELEAEPVAAAHSEDGREVDDGWKSIICFAHQLADMVVKGDAPQCAERTAKALLQMLANQPARQVGDSERLAQLEATVREFAGFFSSDDPRHWRLHRLADNAQEEESHE